MNQPQEPDLTPQPNRILATPDTVQTWKWKYPVVEIRKAA